MFNRDEFNGNWKQFKGEIKKQWGKLTDDDLMQAEGNYDKLVGRIQERYGQERADVEKHVQDFYNKWYGTRAPGRRTA